MLDKCVLTILQLNWNQRLGDKNGVEALNPVDAHDKRYGK